MSRRASTKEDLEAKADKEEVEEVERENRALREKLEKLESFVYNQHPPEEPEVVSEVEVPYLGFVGAAGPARELDTIEDTILLRENLLPENREGLFAGRMEGGSMADIIPNGADVLLRVAKEPTSGRVYVFTLRGQATVKKFRLDHSGPYFEYMDGSGRSIYPEPGEVWHCNAEFVGVLPD